MKIIILLLIALFVMPEFAHSQRLRKTKRKIEKKVQEKHEKERVEQENSNNNTNKPSTQSGTYRIPYRSGYRSGYYDYWSVRDYRNRFERYPSIYIYDERDIQRERETSGTFNLGAEFNEYPYAHNGRWFVESGFQNNTELSYNYGYNNRDNITMNNFYLESTLGFIGLSLDYFSLKETFNDTSANMNFYNFSIFYMLKLEPFQSALYFYIGGNLLDMYEEPAYSEDRKYGGIHYGFKFRTFLPNNVSLYLSSGFHSFKDRIDEDEEVFGVNIYQLKLSYHIDRYAISAGIKMEYFKDFSENFIQNQIGFSIYL
jgi:hypothetical protein